MPRVIIDAREVEVVPGSNLLAAARKLGLDLPALCYHPACTPNTACMACVVKLKGPDRIVPSCATAAEEGMCVESETAEVHALRRTALELLLSDHEDARLECDCTKRDICRLRKYAVQYKADPTRFRGARAGNRTPARAPGDQLRSAPMHSVRDLCAARATGGRTTGAGVHRAGI